MRSQIFLVTLVLLLFSCGASSTRPQISCFSKTTNAIKAVDISDFATIYANSSSELYPYPYDVIASRDRRIYPFSSVAVCVVNYNSRADNVTYLAIGNGVDAISKKCCTGSVCQGGLFRFSGGYVSGLNMYLLPFSNTTSCPILKPVPKA